MSETFARGILILDSHCPISAQSFRLGYDGELFSGHAFKGAAGEEYVHRVQPAENQM